MNIFSILFKLAATLWPLLREYVLSDGAKSKGFGTHIVALFVGAGLLICTMVSIYLGEQAKQNLHLQEPIIKQYNTLYEKNVALGNRNTELQNKVFECEERAHEINEQCKSNDSKQLGRHTYVYDPETKTMVLKQVEEIKK